MKKWDADEWLGFIIVTTLFGCLFVLCLGAAIAIIVGA